MKISKENIILSAGWEMDFLEIKLMKMRIMISVYIKHSVHPYFLPYVNIQNNQKHNGTTLPVSQLE